MKLPEKSSLKTKWDAYQRFHQVWVAEHRGIELVVFTDTQEAIVTIDGSAVHTRGIRRGYEMGAYATTADALHVHTLTTPDGRPCTMANLTEQGQQMLLVDHTHGVAVRGERHYSRQSDWTPTIPHWLKTRGIGAYYPHVDAPPVGASPINVAFRKTYTLEERQAIGAATRGCKAWAKLCPGILTAESGTEPQLQPETEVWQAFEQTYRARSSGSHATSNPYMSFAPIDRTALSMDVILTKGFAGLSVYERLQVVTYGTTAPWVRETVPYLTVASKAQGSDTTL